MPKLTTPQWVTATALGLIFAAVMALIAVAHGASSKAERVDSDFRSYASGQDQINIRVLESLERIEKKLDKDPT